MATLATITILELECPADEYYTESGQGMPDGTEPYETDVITIDADDIDGDTSKLDGAIAAVLDDHGVGQWDGGNTGYDPDGSSMNTRGIVTERFARIDR